MGWPGFERIKWAPIAPERIHRLKGKYPLSNVGALIGMNHDELRDCHQACHDVYEELPILIDGNSMTRLQLIEAILASRKKFVETRRRGNEGGRRVSM